jgi:hypothetical protein
VSIRRRNSPKKRTTRTIILVFSQSTIVISAGESFHILLKRMCVGSRSPQTLQAGDDLASLYAMVASSGDDEMTGLVFIRLSIVSLVSCRELDIG